jgi:hypothetical protein
MCSPQKKSWPCQAIVALNSPRKLGLTGHEFDLYGTLWVIESYINEVRNICSHDPNGLWYSHDDSPKQLFMWNITIITIHWERPLWARPHFFSV